MNSDLGIGYFSPELSCLQKAFADKKPNEIDALWSIISLFMLQGMKSEDLVSIYKTVGVETFVKLLYAVGGKEVKFPTRDELTIALQAAMFYMDREIYKMEWPDIKVKYPTLDVSSIKYTIRIKRLNAFLHQQVAKILKQEEENNGKKVD